MSRRKREKHRKYTPNYVDRRKYRTFDFGSLSPVHTSDNVAKNGDIVAQNNDIVAETGNIVAENTMLPVSATISPFLATLSLVWTGL